MGSWVLSYARFSVRGCPEPGVLSVATLRIESCAFKGLPDDLVREKPLGFRDNDQSK
jgi:hypothetical protein